MTVPGIMTIAAWSPADVSFLIGVVGILAGLAGLVMGFGYQFWSVRRAEFAEAVRASAALAEALRALGTSDDATGKDAAGTHLLQVWRAQGPSLAIYVAPSNYRVLTKRVSDIAADPAGQNDLDNLVEQIDKVGALLWEEHNTFILTSLVHDHGENGIVRRIQDIIESS